jgi:hypothetical protein
LKTNSQKCPINASWQLNGSIRRMIKEIVMSNRAILPVIVIVIAPLGIATWILAAHTIGDSLRPSDSVAIGFAVALLAMMAAAYLLFLAPALEGTNTHFGITLVICGTACVLLALALQFYLAYQAAESSRQVAGMMGDSLKRGERVTVNLQPSLPGSVTGVAYLALFAGIWLAAMGIRIGAGRTRTAEPADVSLKSTEQPPRAEE